MYSPYGELASGYGEGTTDLVVNGTTYTDGDTVFDFDISVVTVMMPMLIFTVGQTMMLMDTLHALMTATITIHRSMMEFYRNLVRWYRPRL